jgi:hypothetical protein
VVIALMQARVAPSTLTTKGTKRTKRIEPVSSGHQEGTFSW